MKIHGFLVDSHTRCSHYHGETDIIAIKFKCCGEYYPCYKCHDESVSHERKPWPKEEFFEKAIFCGNCQTECSIEEYMKTQNCPNCDAAFNPNCQFHYDLYFEM
jgi:uncharacterized CHY-type Zn-finger protein